MFSRQQKAFTLIELMIVVCIISVITCIAVPMLLSAKMAADEVAAVAAVKSVQEAQEVFKKNYWYQIGAFSYANFLDDLCVLPNSTPQLIVQNLALARAQGNWWGALPEPYQGYFFSEVSQYGTTPVSINVTTNGVSALVAQRYGVLAAPASYLVSGRMIFAGDDNGALWKVDPQGDYDITQHLPVTLYDSGSMEANGWQPYGND